jgi:hypothetical protein
MGGLWDAGVEFGDVCCAEFQTGACRHTEAPVEDELEAVLGAEAVAADWFDLALTYQLDGDPERAAWAREQAEKARKGEF